MESKMGTFDPFQHYPDIPASSLPADLPPVYHKQLLSILPEFPGVGCVDRLSNAHRDVNGNLVIDSPVLNRPWEWTENLGEVSTDLGSRDVVKNTGSLNLLTFGARMTGEATLPTAYQKDARIHQNLRSFEDGFSSESLFQRDWRESRVKQTAEDLVGAAGTNISRTRTDEHNLGNATSHGRSDRRTPKGSPSVSTSGKSVRRSSPGHSAFNRLSSSTISDVIDVDALPGVIPGGSTSRGKRKSIVEAHSDDEIVFVEGPVPAAKGAKKTKTTKAQAKKSTKRR